MPEKPDAAEIRKLIQGLTLRFDGYRRDWPQSLYHHTDVQNAASILAHGCLYCRSRSQDHRVVDSAGAEIIRQTPWAHDYARLFFRPRTPTLHGVEGHRHRDRYEYGSRCPVPVYLLFDSAEILCQPGTQVTDGSAARYDHRRGESADFLAQIDWGLVYHDRWFNPNERDEVIRMRQSEVLVPGELSLRHLTGVICRSGPERDTLLRLLRDQAGADALEAFRTRIRLERSGENHFFRDWAYVDDVRLLDDKLILEFHTRAKARFGDDEIPLLLAVRNTDLGEQARMERTRRIPNRLTVNLPWNPTQVEVSIWLDQALGYRGQVSQASPLL